MGRPNHPHQVSDGGYRFTVRGKKYWRKNIAAAWVTIHKLKATDPDAPAPRLIVGLIRSYVAHHDNDHSSEMLEELETWSESAGGVRELQDVDRDTLVKFYNFVRTRLSRRVKKGKEAKPLGRETIRKKVLHAAACFRWAHNRGLIDVMPDVPRLKKQPPNPKALTSEELGKVFESLEASTKTKHATPLLRFILEVGCRPKEARRLRWTQIDFARKCITLTEHKTDAGGDSRVIHLAKTAIEILKAQPRTNRFVFLSSLKKPYTRDGFASILERHGLTPYRLRHTWCQNATDRCVDDKAIIAMMGHRSSRMVEMYRRISDERVRAAAALLDGLSRPELHIQGRKPKAPEGEPHPSSDTAPPPPAQTDMSRESASHPPGELRAAG